MQLPLLAGLLGTTLYNSSIDHRILTPERHISAPRPGNAVVNLAGTHALVGIKAYSFEAEAWDDTLYHIDIPRDADAIKVAPKTPLTLAKGVTSAFWLENDVAAYINTTSNALYTKRIADSISEDGWSIIGDFPTSIESVKLSRDGDGRAKTMVFSAQVYADGDIYAVKDHDSSKAVEEWKGVKVYDSTFVRHWDKWIYPGKRSQLFAIDLGRKDDATGWALEGSIRNLLNGTTLEAPVPPYYDASDFSVSDTHVAFTSKDPNLSPSWHTKQNIYIVSLSGNEKPVKVSKGQHGATSSPTFSNDGKKLAWLQMDRDGYEADRRKIRIASIGGDFIEEQIVLLEDWQLSPTSLIFSKDGRTLLGIVEDAEQEVVFSIDLSNVKKDAKPAMITRRGSVNSIAVLDQGMLVSASSLQHPTDLYFISPHAADVSILATKATRLTNFGQMKGSSLVGVDLGPEAEQFSFPGHKGRTSHGWIHYPPEYDSNQTYPLAVLVHGGPEGAWTNSWPGRWNPMVFAATGMFVITIDPAGSTGFGQAYQEEILEHWGEAPFEDIRAGTKYILERFSNIDAERVVAAGASYGGYMMNWINGHNEDKLYKGLVCHDGILSTTYLYYGTEELWFPEFSFGGVPWKVRDQYEKWSPERFVDKWETPMLVIAGGLDFRIPVSEALGMFNVLQRKGIDSRFVYFEDENHWVLDPKNSLKWHHEVLSWLLKYSAAPKHKIESS